LGSEPQQQGWHSFDFPVEVFPSHVLEELGLQTLTFTTSSVNGSMFSRLRICE
jgi:hypothetical protein